jgi:hypothetical protein
LVLWAEMFGVGDIFVGGSCMQGKRARLGKWRETYALIGFTIHRGAYVYLWRKVVCLFCFVLFVLMRSTEWIRDASDCVLGLFGKLSTRRGAWAWFHDIWTCGLAVQKFLNIEWFLHWKLN